jgi:hypothetical protein
MARRFASTPRSRCRATFIAANSIAFNARRLRIARDFNVASEFSERSYLFTISDITRPHAALRLDGGCGKHFSANEPEPRLVEPDGIEPTTSCLQSRRSPN